MKTKNLLLSFALILLFTVIFITTAAQSPVYEEKGLIWILEPELEYDGIHYCRHCDLFKDTDILSAVKKTQLTEYELIYYDGNKYDKNAMISLGHGGYYASYYFDEEKNLLVISYGSEGVEVLEYFTPDDFMEDWYEHMSDWWNYEKQLIAVRKINSEKIEENEWGFYDKTDIGDKYALMYGTTLVTDYIYDWDKSTSGFYYTNNKDFINIQLNGKWGLADRNGNAAVPFIFDDIEFINDDIAFAKYNGKYGILDVKNTILAVSASPATGSNSLFYGIVLLFASAILIIKKAIKIKYINSWIFICPK